MSTTPQTHPPRPFTFDTVFDGVNVIPAPRPKRAYTPDEVQAARAEAYAEGERSALAQTEAAAAAALGQVSAAAAQALTHLTRIAHEHRAAAADLALAVGRKIAGAALDAFPEAPAAAALAVLARDLDVTPRLIVHVSAADEARLSASLDAAAEAAGFAGQIVLKPNPALSPAAFVFDWGDGRAAFDPEAASQAVDAALKAALAAEGLHAETLIDTTPAPSAVLEA
jgi:flagellar assembly protein FliH